MKRMSLRIRNLSSFTMVFLLVANRATAQLPTEGVDQQWERTVISVETRVGNIDRVVGSAFVVGTTNFQSILVTAQHVIKSVSDSNRNTLIYRYRTRAGKGGIISENDLVKHGFGGWFFHPSADVACRLIMYPGDHAMIDIPTSMLLPKSQLRCGARILVPGFPRGIRSTNDFRPLFRQGIVSRIDSEEILIDAPIFPGNSGSPAVYVPVIKVNPNQFATSAIQQDMLVGVVKSVERFPWQVSGGSSTNEFSFDAMGICYLEPAERIAEVIALDDFVRLRETKPKGSRP